MLLNASYWQMQLSDTFKDDECGDQRNNLFNVFPAAFAFSRLCCLMKYEVHDN